MMKPAASCLLALVLFADHPLNACIWDRDTLASEFARFPEVSALIAGYFPRHSKEFYEWRSKTCREEISKDPAQVNLYDDLAVAQHKLGDHKAAIITMLSKEKMKPGLYETYSNLGTFHIYTGELNEAVKYIDKALAINPKAHFGREQYQKWLVQWLIERNELKNSGADSSEETSSFSRKSMESPIGFAAFIAKKQSPVALPDSPLELKFMEKQRSDALIGVMGMMRFANHDNPLLLEALGDLLLTGDMNQNAAQFAALAYLHAAWKTEDATEVSRLMKQFFIAGRFIHGFSQNILEKMLEEATNKAMAYVDGIRRDEIEWIKDGKDVNLLYETKYLEK